MKEPHASLGCTPEVGRLQLLHSITDTALTTVLVLAAAPVYALMPENPTCFEFALTAVGPETSSNCRTTLQHLTLLASLLP